jgi:branched-chain amino acid transport system ATP-binding protein
VADSIENRSGVELRGVVAGYGGGAPVLRGVNLSAENGQITALIGPNGSGKSSLLKTICGMLDRHEGTIALGGRDISNMKSRRFGRERVRYVPQGNAVFPALSVDDNLRLAAWALGLDRAEYDRALRSIYESFDVLRTKRAGHAAWLSGGEQRQLEFARAFMGDPVLILLDEPSAGLSPKLAKDLYAAIMRLRQPHRAIVLVDQNVSKALEIADVTYELRLGLVTQRIVASSTDATAVVKSWLH